MQKKRLPINQVDTGHGVKQIPTIECRNLFDRYEKRANGAQSNCKAW
jgi:hypothetical protein